MRTTPSKRASSRVRDDFAQEFRADSTCKLFEILTTLLVRNLAGTCGLHQLFQRQIHFFIALSSVGCTTFRKIFVMANYTVMPRLICTILVKYHSTPPTSSGMFLPASLPLVLSAFERAINKPPLRLGTRTSHSCGTSSEATWNSRPNPLKRSTDVSQSSHKSTLIQSQKSLLTHILC